jgi:hypothetical protein
MKARTVKRLKGQGGTVSFPKGLYEQLAADDANLEALAVGGHDPDRQHVITHRFSASAVEALQEIEDLGVELGLATSAIQAKGEAAGRQSGFVLNLQSRATLSPFRVYRESLLMRLIAEACGAEYGDWEAAPLAD